MSRLMCSTQFMGDGCFNNIVDKNISSPYTHFFVILGPMGLHRRIKLRENGYFVTK